MALTVQTLVDDAISQAYPFVRDEKISITALLRQLTSLDREIVGFYALHAPDRIHAVGADITIVKATNSTGYALTVAKLYSVFKYINKDSFEWPIEIVRESQRPSRHPAAFVRSSTLFPVDPFETNWDTDQGDRPFYRGDGDKVIYRYISEPTRVTTLTQTLSSPDEAESYIRESLVLSVLLMSGEAPAERLQEAKQSMLVHRQELLLEITKRTGVSARFGG